MSEEHLMIELLSWVDARERTYGDVQEAWRSTCPRQSLWEDAQMEGLVRLEGGWGADSRVVLTERGRARLHGATRGEEPGRGLGT